MPGKPANDGAEKHQMSFCNAVRRLGAHVRLPRSSSMATVSRIRVLRRWRPDFVRTSMAWQSIIRNPLPELMHCNAKQLIQNDADKRPVVIDADWPLSENARCPRAAHRV